MPIHTKSLNITNYAVNGLGLGHITRLVAINRYIRRLTAIAGIRCEITFLTSSESDNICYEHGFPSFKIPSKTSVATSSISAVRYRKIAKQWIWNAINLLSPDILIVDTFPSGSFNELYDILDFGQKNIFINRAVKNTIETTTDFQQILRHYHLIIKPKEYLSETTLQPQTQLDNTVDLGVILIRSKNEILQREYARRILDIPDTATAVYCTIGGGGDSAGYEILTAFRKLAALHPDYIFVFGAGPLYKGQQIHGSNIRWSQRSVFIEYYAAFDVAFTAGGFNSVHELLHCGIPSVFYPLERAFDDQLRRIESYSQANAGIFAESLESDVLSLALQTALSQRKILSHNAQALVPRNYAIDAAYEILATHISHTRLESALDILVHAELATLALSTNDEVSYCRLLHHVDSTLLIYAGNSSERANSDGYISTHEHSENVATYTKYIFDIAQKHHRSLPDVVRTVRMLSAHAGTMTLTAFSEILEQTLMQESA